MNKKTLLKSIIGTVGIFLVLIASVFLLRNYFDVLGDYIIYCGVLIACSIAAGLLFKGKLYAWVWLSASIIFTSFICAWDFEAIITLGLPCVLMPLTVPYLIVKSIVLSVNEEKELSAKAETVTENETHLD